MRNNDRPVRWKDERSMLAPNSDINDVLKVGGKPTLLARLRRSAWWIALVVIAIGGIAWWSLGSDTATTIRYTTIAAKTGDLTVTVSATGTVEPVNQVDVSSELSGTIAKVNVDFNDTVKAGEVLAVINTDKLQAQANSSKATLLAKKAAVVVAEATVTESKASLNRISQLAAQNYSSKADLAGVQATYDRAVASLASAHADVDVAAANLAANETDLAKADIKSPISGVVLNRTVDPGSTVAASLSAPVLFIIAEDLKRMRLLVDVDEADAGSVHEGQDATFTVEAFTDRTFPAKVTQLRYAATTTDNVVTYTAVLSVDNSDLAIRPGMTATANIIVKQDKGVLLIPNAALRYAPASTTTATASRSSRGNFLTRIFPSPPRQTTRTAAGGRIPEGQKRIWVLRDGKAVGVLVTPGATDGSFTEILSGDISVGDEVITDASQSR